MQSKRSFAVLLTLLLVLSSSVMMGAVPQQPDRDLLPDEYLNRDSETTLEGPVSIDPGNITSLYEAQEYRVIVQLESDAAIQESIGRNEKYHELPPGLKRNLERGILGEQRGILQNLERRGVSLEILDHFTVAVNGFSAMVHSSDFEEIKSTPGVKDLFISNQYERPDPIEIAMYNSHDMIGSQWIWDEVGYQGEGMVVAVLDSGIQWTHPDFNPDYSDYDLEIEQEWIDSLDLPGVYKTPKVPYGYNYIDNRQTIKDMGDNHHGTHVAGVVAADGEIKGVAPKAQLLDMQIYSYEEGVYTYDDIWLRATEDALTIGVDAINMSIGLIAEFYQPNNAVDQAITNARDDGVVFAVSAANAAYSTWQMYGLPRRKNPDIGTVASPSINKDAISVASAENDVTTNHYISYMIDGEEDRAPYHSAAGYVIHEEFDEEEYVVAGLGYEEDFEGLDLDGKLALIARGEIFFRDKIMNAQHAGAKGVILYNNDGDGLVDFDYPVEEGEIPALFIGQSYGEQLAGLEEPVLLTFPDDLISAPSALTGQMSPFTSWGTSPTLDLKPEVTAPGGNIYSTMADGTYGTASGTSMSAPQVAGSTTLVQQYLLDQGMDRQDIAERSKLLHMNTAQPLTDEFAQFYSPRRQGAGLIRPDNAINTPVTVVNAEDAEAKVELRDFQHEVFTMTLEATNHSDQAVSYDVSVDVLGDFVFLAENEEVFRYDKIFPASFPLEGTSVSMPSEVTVAPGMTENIEVVVDISNAIVPGTGQRVVDHPNLFVEGFIRLIEQVESEDEAEGNGIDLTVPFVGYYGDWAGEESPRILDDFQFLGENQVFESGGFVNQDFEFMGYDPELGYEGAADRLVLTPGNPEGNATMTPIFSLLRNAAEYTMKIYNEEGDVVRVIADGSWLRKSFQIYNPFYYIEDFTWDGTDEHGESVEDGTYIFEMAFLPHYEDGVWQTREFSMTVDGNAPVVENIRYNQRDKILSFDAYDEGVGIYSLAVYLDGEVVVEPELNEEGHYMIEDFEYHERQDLKIFAIDKMMNEEMYEPDPFVRSNRPANVGPGN